MRFIRFVGYVGAITALLSAQVRIRSVSASELQQLSGTSWQSLSLRPVTPTQRSTGTYAIRCLAGQPRREHAIRLPSKEVAFPDNEQRVSDPTPPPVPYVATKWETFQQGAAGGTQLVLAQGLSYDRGCEGDKVRQVSLLRSEGDFSLQIDHPRGTTVTYFIGPNREVLALVPNPREPIVVANLGQSWFDKGKRADPSVGEALRKAGAIQEDPKMGLRFCGTISARGVPGRSNACLIEIRGDACPRDAKGQSTPLVYLIEW
ncbi:MAG: hypothetical protein NZZ60_00540 [Bacteroidia bacterium]|nr:hypothetical protein [Bacteroidia bacterium]